MSDLKYFVKSEETIQTENDGFKTRTIYRGTTPWSLDEREGGDFTFELENILAKASEYDIVKIQICGSGGNADLAERIISAIKFTKAEVSFLTFTRASSVYTYLLIWAFLEGLKVEITEGTYLSFHDFCVNFGGEISGTDRMISTYQEIHQNTYFYLISLVLNNEEFEDVTQKAAKVSLSAKTFYNRLSAYEGDITLVPFCKPAKKKA